MDWWKGVRKEQKYAAFLPAARWVSIICTRSDNPSAGQAAAPPRDATSPFLISPPYPACYNYENSFIFCLWQRGTTPSENKMLSLLQKFRVPGCIPLPNHLRKKTHHLFRTFQTFYGILSLLFVFPQRSFPLFPSLWLLPLLLTAWALAPMH